LVYVLKACIEPTIRVAAYFVDPAAVYSLSFSVDTLRLKKLRKSELSYIAPKQHRARFRLLKRRVGQRGAKRFGKIVDLKNPILCLTFRQAFNNKAACTIGQQVSGGLKLPGGKDLVFYKRDRQALPGGRRRGGNFIQKSLVPAKLFRKNGWNFLPQTFQIPGAYRIKRLERSFAL